MKAVSARVRERLKEEMKARRYSQRDVAEILEKRTGETWSQSRVGKILTGAVETRLDDVAAIADAIGLMLSEAVRDRGNEFYAEMTPSELRILERMRRRPGLLAGVKMILDLKPEPEDTSRRPTPQRHIGRPRNSERDANNP